MFWTFHIKPQEPVEPKALGQSKGATHLPEPVCLKRQDLVDLHDLDQIDEATVL